MANPTSLPAWKELQQLQNTLRHSRLTDLFSTDPERFKLFSLQQGNLFLDYSKNFIDSNVMNVLLELARQQQLDEAIARLSDGIALDLSIAAVPYMSLRDRSCLPVCIDGHDISSEIRNALFSMRRICEEFRAWNWRGYNGKPLTDIVTLGVGGSGNGAEMVCRALSPYHSANLKSHFVANADPQAFKEKLAQLRPDTTLFIISSKSFSTHETLQNAQLAKDWLVANAGNENAVKQHLIAITSNRAQAESFGIAAEHVLPTWNWLPGRYSFWSTAGLPIALTIGFERFEQLLEGAQQMDQHFTRAPMSANLPIILGLLGIWYVNFWNLSTHAILPYSGLLDLLPGFLQHNLMEANGKSVDLGGATVNYATGPVIWGSAGTKNQHTYFQALHQGTQVIPADFIVVATDTRNNKESASTFYHFLAQSEALMRGSDPAEAQNDPEQILPGNKPSTCLLLTDLSPTTLGQLLALYEHVALVQSVIWNINPFSRWGTKMGKRYTSILQKACEEQIVAYGKHDNSTLGLLETFQRIKGDNEARDPCYGSLNKGQGAYRVF